MHRLSFAVVLIILFTSCQTSPVEGAWESTVSLEREEQRPDYSLKTHIPRAVAVTFPGEKEFPPVSEDSLECILDQLSLNQKIGQRFISWVPGTKITDRSKKLIREGYVGGIILSSRNIATEEQVKKLTSDLQSCALNNSPPIGLLIGIDQEGGRVNRLALERTTRFSSPFYWKEFKDPLFVEALAFITGKEVRQLGCNVNFAPVLDLYAVPDDSIIGDRSMGPDAWQVGEQGIYYIHGAHRAGIASVVKHFPGHGRTTVDSHFNLPVVNVDEAILKDKDLVPFQMAIDYGIDAIMTAHILYPQLDPELPATLSSRIIKDLLRAKMGFEGVIISDDIEMLALSKNFTKHEIFKLGIKAGVDIFIVLGNSDILKLKNEIMDLYKAGEITTEEIDAGVRRILRLKIKYGLIKG